MLDLDDPAGWQRLARTVDENSCLASSPVAMTPSGGTHYFFQPTGLGNRAGFLLSLDWRGVGGYVVAPPSTGASGAYEWAVTPDEVELEPVPTRLIELLQRPKMPAGSVNITRATRGDAYARAALEREFGRLALAAEGQRNDQLNRSAHTLGQLVGGRLLDASEVGDVLLAVALRVGLGESEAEATIKSGMLAGIKQPRCVP